MKKTNFIAILMLMVFSVLCNSSLFARTTPSNTTTPFARTTHVVLGNTFFGIKTASNIELSP